MTTGLWALPLWLSATTAPAAAVADDAGKGRCQKLMRTVCRTSCTRQRRKGPRGNPTMKELQFLVEHHLYRQQQGADECSSESCLSDRPSPDTMPAGEELPVDEEGWSTGDAATNEAFEKLRCQMEEFSRESLLEASGGMDLPLSKEEMGPCASNATLTQNTKSADGAASAPEKTQKPSAEKQK